MSPTADDPATAQFATRRAGEPSEEAVMKTTPPQPAAPAEAVEEVHDTVPPAPVAEADAAAPMETETEEVDTADATLATPPPAVAAVEASGEGSGRPSAAETVGGTTA